MSSSTASSFYTSDLEIMTALMLDRSALLDSVTDAVTYEDKKPAAAKMISVLGAGAFLSLMPALLADADINIRNKAYLALGNLIASSNRAVAEAALKCGYNALLEQKFVFTARTAPGIAYTLTSMAERVAMWPNVNDILGNVWCGKNPVLLYAEEHLTEDLPPSVQRDLLWVFKRLEDPCWKTSVLLKPTLLITLLEQMEKKTFKTALHFLGDLVSDDKFFESHSFEPTYNYLWGMLLKDDVPFGTTVEHLWMLSNLVTECGMGLQFLQDEDLFDAVANRIRLDEDNAVVSEAVWVLLNSLAHVDLKDLSHFRLLETHDVLAGFLQGDLGNTTVRRETEIHCDKLMAEISARYLPADEVTYEECGANAEVDYSAWNLPYEVDRPVAGCGFTIYNPPSAVDLLRKKIIYDLTSETVFNLIASLEANNLAFTPIPENTVLTVEDLKALEARGYAIVRGAIGINPAVTVALCGSQ